MADLSFGDIQNLVRAALQAEHAGATYVYIRDCYADAVVYSVEKQGGASDPPGGVYYRRSYVISESESNFGVTLGKAETVAPKREYQTVRAFSLTTFSTGDDWVEYEGLVFEAGDYPDKGVSFTPADLISAAASFAPVANDLEHRDTILSGKLGSLMSVRPIDGGAALVGRVRIPKWLHDVNGGQPIKTSLAWSGDKAIVGNALTLNPRIASAQVAAAFAAASEPSKPYGPATGAHDHAATKGHSPQAAPPKEKKQMKIRDIFSALASAFSGGGSVDLDQEIGVGEAASVTFADPESTRLRESLAAAQSALIAQAARSFCDALIADRRIVPAQSDGVIAMFTAAAQDDIAAGAKFSAESGALLDGDRVKALRAMLSAAPQHSLTEEQMRDAQAVFSGAPQPKGPVVVDSAEIFAARKAAAGGN